MELELTNTGTLEAPFFTPPRTAGKTDASCSWKIFPVLEMLMDESVAPDKLRCDHNRLTISPEENGDQNTMWW